MAVFVALNHTDDAAQVNVTMSDEAARGTWIREDTSTATLDDNNGEFLQTTHAGTPTQDRQLRGPQNTLTLTLIGFVAGHNSGEVQFAIEGGPGTFGTSAARWTRLEG